MDASTSAPSGKPKPRGRLPPQDYAAHPGRTPISVLKPTTRFVPVIAGAGQVSGHVFHVWRTRDNRKGRHNVAVSKEFVDSNRGTGVVPERTTARRQVLRGLWKMCVRHPIWDISYDVAFIFTLGSAIWCINGCFVWFPIVAPSTGFSGESGLGGGITACIGATVFEIGSVLLMLEAVNENRADCFGWALDEALDSTMHVLRPEHECRHHHAQKRTFLKGAGGLQTTGVGEKHHETGSGHEGAERRHRTWSWWPTWHELKTHYLRDIGFLACSSQMVGATVFWIAGFTGLPPIYDSLAVPAANGIFWLPQVVGGTGFIISGLLFMVEVQEKWWKPATDILGWHIGLWNFIGAIGFTLCGALGFGYEQPGVEYAAALSTFVGSWAFLIGSLVQWYESLDKYPVSVDKNNTLSKMTVDGAPHV